MGNTAWADRLSPDWYALSAAIENDEPAVVARLLKENPSLAEGKDLGGGTPFFSAARQGRAQCLAVMLPYCDARAVMGIGLDQGKTPLMTAAQSGSLECVRLLLPLSDLKARTSFSQYTALTFAVQGGNPHLVRELLPHCDATTVSADGNTPLLLALEFGEPECLAALIPHSNVNAVNSNGDTALIVAARESNAPAVKLLLPCSDWTRTSRKGFTAAHIALLVGAWQCVDLLVHTNPDPLTAARLALAKAGAAQEHLLPACKAWVERAQLDVALVASECSLQQESAAPAGPPSSPSSILAADSPGAMILSRSGATVGRARRRL